RLLTWRAAWMARTGQPFVHAEGSMSKLKAGEVAVKVSEQAVQLLGGYGYITDFPVEKWYRDSKIYTLFEGTSEIQRLVISRALLLRRRLHRRKVRGGSEGDPRSRGDRGSDPAGPLDGDAGRARGVPPHPEPHPRARVDHRPVRERDHEPLQHDDRASAVPSGNPPRAFGGTAGMASAVQVAVHALTCGPIRRAGAQDQARRHEAVLRAPRRARPAHDPEGCSGDARTLRGRSLAEGEGADARGRRGAGQLRAAVARSRYDVADPGRGDARRPRRHPRHYRGGAEDREQSGARFPRAPAQRAPDGFAHRAARAQHPYETPPTGVRSGAIGRSVGCGRERRTSPPRRAARLLCRRRPCG